MVRDVSAEIGQDGVVPVHSVLAALPGIHEELLPLLYSTVHESGGQYSTVLPSRYGCGTVQYSTLRTGVTGTVLSTLQYSTVYFSSLGYSTVQESGGHYSTVRLSRVEYSTVQGTGGQYITIQYRCQGYTLNYEY